MRQTVDWFFKKLKNEPRGAGKIGWIETITKEGFQLAVKEAMCLDIEKIEGRLSQLSDRVSRIEGSMDGSMHAYEASVRSMFAEFKVEIFRRLLNKPENGGGVKGLDEK